MALLGFPYRCWAEIDLRALRENLAWIRHRAGSKVKILTVVKADAYGHGLKQIAAHLMQSGTDIFGVANLVEAKNIRAVGKGWPILMLGSCLPHEMESAIREEVMPTISGLEEAASFSRLGQKLGKEVAAHFKVDTGMGRLGASIAEAPAIIEQVKKMPFLKLTGIYTHYASVEDDAPFSASQQESFRQLLKNSSLNVGRMNIHANNSGGILWQKKSMFNTIRPGLLVYGIIPPGLRPTLSPLKKKLRPVLTWKTRIGFIKEAPPGSGLSYGRTFVTKKKMRVATITVGYGDGFLRSGSNKSEVLIQGKRCPVLGRITMDQTIVDISELVDPKVGDEVVIIGEQEKQTITASDLAQSCNPISAPNATVANPQVATSESNGSREELKKTTRTIWDKPNRTPKGTPRRSKPSHTINLSRPLARTCSHVCFSVCVITSPVAWTKLPGLHG